MLSARVGFSRFLYLGTKMRPIFLSCNVFSLIIRGISILAIDINLYYFFIYNFIVLHIQQLKKVLVRTEKVGKYCVTL